MSCSRSTSPSALTFPLPAAGRPDARAAADRCAAPRERSVLELLAEGRSNKAIGQRLAITQSAVQKHVSTIFNKLGLPASENDDRRIIGVLAYLLAEANR